MPTIHILPEHIANQIAAGEVVEGPSSIIKELVENSIDAKATKINIEVSKNLLRIQVIDNGLGMSAEDLPLAFKKHATSKISSIEDLYKLITNGFRGEALPSIAAVSKLTCISKRKADEHASKIYLENGKETISQTGAASGTNITVDELFFNTPARLKFLKSDTKEKNNLIDITRALALSHPEIAFCLKIDQKETLSTSGSGDLSKCIAQVFSADLQKSLIPVKLNRGELNISGYTSDINLTRSDKRGIVTILNGRAIQCYIMRSAIEAVYKQHLAQGKYPITVINLSIPAEDVDVNVHPNKKEVKYKNTNLIYSSIGDAIAKALADHMYQSNRSFQPSLEQHLIKSPDIKPASQFNSALVNNSDHYTHHDHRHKLSQENLLTSATKEAAMEIVKSHFDSELPVSRDRDYRKDFSYEMEAGRLDSDSRKFIGRLGSVDISIVQSTVPQTIITRQGNKTSFDLVVKREDENQSLILRGDFIGENWLKDKYLEFLGDIGKQILDREILESYFKGDRAKSCQSRPASKPSKQELDKIWQRDNYTCVYCAKALLHPDSVKIALSKTPEKQIINSHLASYDHHLPASKFSTLNEDERNLYACCQECNRRKSDSLATKTWNPVINNAWENVNEEQPLRIGGLPFTGPRLSNTRFD